MALYLALVHYPVLNRKGEVIASAITNLDLHDLARSCCTYDVPVCYIVTPLKDQQLLSGSLLSHWRDGIAKELHPERGEALRRLKVVDDVAAAVEDIRSLTGRKPVLWATTARKTASSLSHREARRLLAEGPDPRLMLLGTGWGLAPAALQQVDAVLEPIVGINGYNHLSVRCAAAILMDRLLHAERGA